MTYAVVSKISVSWKTEITKFLKKKNIRNSLKV